MPAKVELINSLNKSKPEILSPEDALRFERLVEYTDWVVKNSLPLYLSTHKVPRYIAGLLPQISFEGEEHSFSVEVFSDNEPNMFVLPNGRIFISDGFIPFAEQTSRLLFGLRHEERHVVNGDAERQFERQGLDNPETIRSASVLHYFGQKILQEWEADIEAFFDLDEKGINPLGGIDLFEKFRRRQLGSAISITHGSNADRVLNLRQSTYLRDLTSLNKENPPIPEEIIKAVKESRYTSAYDALIDGVASRNLNSINRALQKINADESLLALKQIVGEYKNSQRIKTESTRLWSELLNDVAVTLRDKIADDMEQKNTRLGRNRLSRQQLAFLLNIRLEVDGGIRVATKEIQDMLFPKKRAVRLGYSDNVIHKRFDGYGFQDNLHAGEDTEEFLAVLTTGNFRHFGVKGAFIPVSIMDKLAERVLEKGIFSDENDRLNAEEFVAFTDTFLGRFDDVYKQAGVGKFDRRKYFTAVLEHSARTLSDQDRILLSGVTAGLRKSTDQEAKLAGDLERLLYLISDISANEAVLRAEEDRLNKLDKGYVDIARTSDEIGMIIHSTAHGDARKLLEFMAQLRRRMLEGEAGVKFPETFSHFMEGQFLEEYQYVSDAHPRMDDLLLKIKLSIILDTESVYSGWQDDIVKVIADGSFGYDEIKRLFETLSYQDVLEHELGISLGKPEYYNNWSDWFEKEFKERIYSFISEFVSKGPSHQELTDYIRQIYNDFPFSHYGYNYISAVADIHSFDDSGKQGLMAEIFSRYAFDLSDPEQLLSLYYVSTFFDDLGLAIRIQNAVWEKLAEALSYQEGMSVLDEEIESGRLLSLNAFHKFIEKTANTHEEIIAARERIMQLLTQSSSSLKLGEMILSENFVDIIFREFKSDLLIGAIGNGVDDLFLKQVVYKTWMAIYDNTPEAAERLNLDAIIQTLYRLDPQSKFLMIRHLLCGEGGILTSRNTRDRERLIDFFLENYIEAKTPEEQRQLTVIRKVMKEFVKKTPYDIIYFVLAPMLQERFLHFPGKEIPWKKIIRKEGVPRIVGDDEVISNAMVKETLELMYGKGVDAPVEDKEYRKNRESYEKKVLGILGNVEVKTQISKMNPINFLREALQQMGAPGKRLLQIAVQYISFPPGINKDEFLDVFDKVEGQSKITGQATLLRDWPEARTVLSGLEGEPLGGGSLNRVFATVGDGEKQVVKILNPNAWYHATVAYKAMKDVLTILANEDSRFLPVQDALDDILEWIKNDINYTGFLEEDERFRNLYQGYSPDTGYTVKIPVTYGPERMTFQREQRQEGTNLTEWKKLESQGHDMRQIATTLAQFFFEQIQEGQLLSNMNPGNIRVQGNDTLVILDRNYYLKLEDRDKQLLFSILSADGDTAQIAGSIFGYLDSFGQKISQAQKEAVIQELAAVDPSLDNVDKILATATILRKNRLKPPIQMTLLINNFFFLDLMVAKRAGFAGISQAFMGE